MSTMLDHLDESGFDQVVGTGSGLIAVEMTAEWCGACKVMAPALEDVAREMEGRVRFFQVDADANPGIAVRFGVRGLPTVLVFRDGALIERIIGAQSRRALRSRIPT